MSKLVFLYLALGCMQLQALRDSAEDSTEDIVAVGSVLAGTVIDGRYKVLEPFIDKKKLGEGSFGRVMKAMDLGSNRLVAVKYLLQHDQDEKSFRKDLIAELSGCKAQNKARETARQLYLSPGLILECLATNIKDDGRYKNTGIGAYIVYELVDGLDMSDVVPEYLQHHKDEIMEQLLEAVYIMSKSNLIHKDLKPANIKIWETKPGHPQVKILDFGMVNMADSRFNLFAYPWSPPEAMLEDDHGRDHKFCPDHPDTWDVWAIAAIDYWMSQGGDTLLDSPASLSGKEESEAAATDDITFYKCLKFGGQSTAKVEQNRQLNGHMTKAASMFMELCDKAEPAHLEHVMSWITEQFSDAPIMHRLMAAVLQAPPCARPTATELYEQVKAAQGNA